MGNDEYDVQYCDIDEEETYGKSDWMLLGVSENRVKDATELAHLKRYCYLLRAYHDKQTLIRTYKSMIDKNESTIKRVNRDAEPDADATTRVCLRNICSYQSKVDEESTYLLTYENELAKLEHSKPIQAILLRENKGFEEIRMTFAKFTIRSDDVSKDNRKTKQELDGVAIRTIIWSALFILFGLALVLCPLLALN